MTAKEYFEQNAMYEIKKIYEHINPAIIKIMEDFAILKCKEQRELCGMAIQENNYYSNMHGEIYETIMTAKQPDIESEVVE